MTNGWYRCFINDPREDKCDDPTYDASVIRYVRCDRAYLCNPIDLRIELANDEERLDAEGISRGPISQYTRVEPLLRS